MQVDSPERLRNVAIVGHNDSGKTTLASAMLYTGGATSRLNKVEDGNTLTDYDPEEIEREISIGLGTCYVPWGNTKVNLIDTPGYGIFMNEIRCGMRAADSALLCIDMLSGPQVTSEKAWEFAESLNLPVAFHITRADRDNTDFARSVAELQEAFGRTAMPIQVPIGQAHDFVGIVDLVTGTAYTFDRDGNGKGKKGEVPAELQDQVDEWRSHLVEAVAENDEALMEKFFEEGDLTGAELEEGIRSAMSQRALFPITLSSALHGIGTSPLLDSLVSFHPNPLDHRFTATDAGGEPIDAPTGATAIVFKTLNDPFSGKISLLRVVSGEISSDKPLFNSNAEDSERLGSLLLMQGKTGETTTRAVTGEIVGVAKLKVTHTGDTLCDKASPCKIDWIAPPVSAMSFAIEPKSKGDEEKIGESVSKLIEEDTSLRTGRDAQTGEYILTGTGRLHVEIAVARMKTRYKVDVILHAPRVPYRETIRKAADGHGRHKKQSGGRGQFADCKIAMEPLSRDEDYEFKDEIYGGSIPQQYRPAVDKGIVEAAGKGFLAGYPVVNFRVRLLDGQYHDVDSSEMAFRIAGSLAFKDAMSKAGATILEPVMAVEINTTEEFMGDVMSDLSQRRGRPQGMEAKGDKQIVKAQVPMAEMLNYATALRSMTQGRSNFTMDFSHYEEAPRNVQEKIIADAKKGEDD
jgi:elongation factor G